MGPGLCTPGTIRLCSVQWGGGWVVSQGAGLWHLGGHTCRNPSVRPPSSESCSGDLGARRLDLRLQPHARFPRWLACVLLLLLELLGCLFTLLGLAKQSKWLVIV